MRYIVIGGLCLGMAVWAPVWGVSDTSSEPETWSERVCRGSRLCLEGVGQVGIGSLMTWSSYVTMVTQVHGIPYPMKAVFGAQYSMLGLAGLTVVGKGLLSFRQGVTHILCGRPVSTQWDPS